MSLSTLSAKYTDSLSLYALHSALKNIKSNSPETHPTREYKDSGFCIWVSCALPFPQGDPSINTPVSSRQWQEGGGYLREFQGNGLQVNITFYSGSVPRAQRLFGAVSLQKSRCTHRLQDVVMVTTLHAPIHGLLSVTRMAYHYSRRFPDQVTWCNVV